MMKAEGRGERRSPDLDEVRCAECRRLLFRGRLVGEIRCRCGYVMRFERDHKKNIDTPVSRV